MKGLIRSFYYAFRGLLYQIACERNFRIHLFAAATVLFFSRFFSFSTVEWCVLVLIIAAVISTESLNTALEKTNDAVSTMENPFIGRAKDCAAASVLILAIASVAAGILLFWDLEAFKKIIVYFSVWYRSLLLVLYCALVLFFVFCKKTYKKDC